jgi:hypothetical protein
MSNSAESAGPKLAAYAAERGLSYEPSSMALPRATQLLRHGFMQEIRNLLRGNLPGGLADAWLAHVDYAYAGRTDIDRRFFTLVLVQAPQSVAFAVRVLCHDHDLTELDVSNPDADRQVVELDDKAVRLESEGFLARYALSTDADQDQLRVWQIFDPSLIEWLTSEAPEDFSFELQDGALCCFVPGVVADADALDALCAAAARVFAHVVEIDSGGAVRTEQVEDGRAKTVERELAEHRFDSPPETVKAAAKAFGHGPLIGDRAWKLGAEAFFREQARAHGMERIEVAAFRAANIEVFLPGVVTDAAAGPVAGHAGGYLALTTDKDYDDLGWMAAVIDLSASGLSLTAVPSPAQAEAAGLKLTTDGRSLIVWQQDEGARKRTAKALAGFLAAVDSLLGSRG